MDAAEAKRRLTTYSSPYRAIELDGLNAASVNGFVEARVKIPEAIKFAEQYERAFPGKDAYHIRVIRDAESNMNAKAQAEVESVLRQLRDKHQDATSGKEPAAVASWAYLKDKCELVLKLAPNTKECSAWIAEADTAKARAGEETNGKIASARAPKSLYRGAGWDQVIGEIRKAYHDAYGANPKQVSIQSDWQTSVDPYSLQEYDDIRAWIIAEQGEDHCRVYAMTFRRERAHGAKRWGALRSYSSGDTYLMLCSNLGAATR
jgi:hypothetical protein